MSEWVQMIALAAIWFWAGHTFGSARMLKRTKGDVDAVSTLARNLARLERNMRFAGPGLRGEIKLPIEHKGVEYEIVLAATNPDRKHKEAGK